MAARVPFSQVHRTPLESLTCEPHESEHYLAFAGEERKRSRLSSFLISRWTLIILAGAATGLTASGIDYGLEKLFAARFAIVKWFLNQGAPPVALLFVHVGLCTILASFAGLLVCFVEPLAAGSGIPEVKSRLNGVDLPNVVHPRTYIAKAVGVLFSVSAGLPVGKEGPMIHSGAILGGMFSWLGKRFFAEQYNMDVETRELISAGGAAGVTAAFGAPLGGVLFVMEEGSSFWNARTLLRAFICAASSALVLNFFIVGFNTQLPWGSLGALGGLTFGTFSEDNKTTYYMWELPFFILMGMGGGLLGAMFNGLNILITRWRMKNVGPRGVKRFIEVLFVIVVISSCAFIPTMIYGTCYVPTVEAKKHDSWIQCDPQPSDESHSFSASIGLFVTPSEDSIKVLFHDSTHLDNWVLVAFAIFYFLAACWTYGLGVPSGLFVPSLLTGAVLGRLVGQLLHGWVPIDTSLPGTYALIGSAAVLAGMARITISLAVILVEATGNTQWMLPVLFTVAASKWVGDFFNKGLYDIHIDLKHVPVLEAFPEHSMKSMRTSDVMIRDVKTLNQIVTVRTIMDLLAGCNHHGFPVVNEDSQQLCGMITRSTLQHLLHQGRHHGVFDRGLEEGRPIALDDIPFVEIARKQPEFPTLQEVREVLHHEDYNAVLDLKPYTDCGAFSVQEDTTLRRAFVLFRSIGLRHLPVTSSNSYGQLVGILSRKDLILEHPE